MPGILYVVATPLGNLQDVSAHAATCLRDAAFVYAEDTRRTRILLDHLGIQKTARSLHSHNEGGRIREVLEHLEAGQSVALVSDAGTPAISDPGAELVAAAHAAGCKVSPVAGPSALTAALSVAGFRLPITDILFVGFLAARGKDHTVGIARLAAHPGIAVLFESPHRLADTLAALAVHEPERPVCMCRELTKMYEEVRRTTVSDLATWAATHEVLGELTVVLGPSTREVPTIEEATIDAAVTRCLAAGLSARDTATAVSAVLSLPKRTVYARCLKLAP